MTKRSTLTAIFRRTIHQLENRLHKLARDPKTLCPAWDEDRFFDLAQAYWRDFPERMGLENTVHHLRHVAYE